MKISLTVIVIFFSIASSQPKRIVGADSIANEVKKEFLHSWNAYKQYAWGADGVRPLSKKPYTWYDESLLMTPIDAFDTMILMGLTKEADEANLLLLSSLSFDKHLSVKNFEITIRILGGLLSAYQMTNEKKFLSMAEDLGNRLLPVFESKTGLPHVNVNLKTGVVEGDTTNPAETGTLLIEFGTLSKLTGKPIYYEKAKRALVETYKRRSAIGLVGQSIDVNTGKWTATNSHLGGLIDSYYEYLFKCWKLFGDEECKKMWDEGITAINNYLADTVRGELWYGRVDMNTGTKTIRAWGGLESFFPGLLAYSGDIERAKRLQLSSYAMWNKHGIEPESYDYVDQKVRRNGYPLRPEIIESAYYLYVLTGDTTYQQMGVTFFNSLKQYCRTDAGYAELKNVITKEKEDMMESFFFAETLKYLYLLFAPPSTLDLNSVVFNTEAHPIRKTW
ncbi:MAG: glycoside hydrolase family 47 protein [Ignavibacteriales bacterium]|nr:glycoside hydrolase family 47 protein [Ignavibacteriales bacterium]